MIFLRRFLSPAVIFSFITQSSLIYAAQGNLLNLPEPGKMISLSSKFVPAYVKGISIYPNDPFKFDFIIDTGDTKLNDQQFKEESNRLIKYFMTALTVPEKEDWVNLSPYEKDRIVPESLGVTEMGRDMLAQDYVLKQLTSSLIYPEKAIGKEFWSKVYAQAQKQFGTTNIPVNTFNKVWIVPSQAVVWEHDNSAYVVRSHLKVMLEEDYLSLQKHMNDTVILSAAKDLNKINSIRDSSASPQNDVNALGSQIVRKIVLPKLEKEVNEGANFATLRQVFNSAILAAWYKQNLKQTILGQVYANQNKVAGVDLADKQIKQKIYERYLQAFKKGAFNFIKEDSDPVTRQSVPRKYFSGGVVDLAQVTDTLRGPLSGLPQADQAVIANQVGSTDKVTVEVMNAAMADQAMVAESGSSAMTVKRTDIKRIGVLTGGGLATGHNSLITAALREAEAQGPDVEILGIPNGWAGLTKSDLKNKIRRLTVKEMERFENQGGSVIKSSRTNPVKVSDEDIKKELIRSGHADPDTVSAAVKEETRLALVQKKVEKLISTLKELNIDGLIVMGGDDTNGVSSIIHAFAPDFPILGVPKTMDNDVYLPEGVPTYGYDSFVAAAANSLRFDMRSAIDQDRIFVVETFGRDSGFTTIGAAARAGATLTLIPEQGEPNIDQLVEQVRAFYLKNHYALIVLSEGVKFEQTNAGGTVEVDQFGHKKLKGGGDALAKILKERLKDIIDPKDITNAAKLDYATREAPISLEDRMITQALGRDAVRLLRDGLTGRILYTDRNYNVQAMSFPDEQGVVTYLDDTGVKKQMNISKLRGDSPDISTDARRKIGGRVAQVEEGGIDRDAYVAGNQAIFGERSLIMKIKLELDRINKEMAFDIAKMSHLLNLSSELKQLEFDIHELSEELTQVESEIAHLKQTSAKGGLIQRADVIKKGLLELITMKAMHISAGKTDAAQAASLTHVNIDPLGGINLDANLYNMQVLRDGNGRMLPISRQPIGRFMKIKGFKPVFLNIERNINLPARLGVKLDRISKQQLAMNN